MYSMASSKTMELIWIYIYLLLEGLLETIRYISRMQRISIGRAIAVMTTDLSSTLPIEMSQTYCPNKPVTTWIAQRRS